MEYFKRYVDYTAIRCLTSTYNHTFFIHFSKDKINNA